MQAPILHPILLQSCNAKRAHQSCMHHNSSTYAFTPKDPKPAFGLRQQRSMQGIPYQAHYQSLDAKVATPLFAPFKLEGSAGVHSRIHLCSKHVNLRTCSEGCCSARAVAACCTPLRPSRERGGSQGRGAVALQRVSSSSCRRPCRITSTVCKCRGGEEVGVCCLCGQANDFILEACVPGDP